MITTKKKKLKTQANKYVTLYLKCKNDFNFFCKKYILLEAPGSDIHFNPYRKQIELTDLIDKFHYLFVLKSRQIGISTIIQAYATWLSIFYDNTVVGIISKDGAEATDFARVIRGMIEKLPRWMKPPGGAIGPGFNKRTERSFILTNGSKVYASPVNPNAPEKTLRGKALTFLVIDEAAFVNYIDTAWTAIVPALATNQMAARKVGVPYGTVVLSTPNKTNGVGEWYFKRYQKAIMGSDIFTPFVIHWKMIPELADDPDWYKIQCLLFDNDKKKIAQELDLKFLPTEGSFFDTDTAEAIQNATVKPKRVSKLYNGEILTFSEPRKGKYYIHGVDTAPEHGEDKSAITVWDYETLEQVAEYQGKCKALDFVKAVKVMASTYPGLIVVESNSYGNQVVEQLNNSEYSFSMYKEKRGKDMLFAGLSNNSKTRPLMIDALYSYVSEYPESIKSERLALELTGLVTKTNGRVEADTGAHDDLALATSCAFYVRKYDPPLLINTEASAALTSDMAGIIRSNTELHDEFTNASIIKHAKENIGDMGGFNDILKMYENL